MNATGIDDRPRRIYNPVQRDAATFLETSEETGGTRTLVELEVAPGGKVTPHYHLTYSERFKVIEGRLTVEIDGVRHELEPGDEAAAAPGRLHAWSNPGAERSVAHVELRPGSPGFEKALRVVYGLASDGLVRERRPSQPAPRGAGARDGRVAPARRLRPASTCPGVAGPRRPATRYRPRARAPLPLTRPSRATPVRLRPRRARGQLSAQTEDAPCLEHVGVGGRGLGREAHELAQVAQYLASRVTAPPASRSEYANGRRRSTGMCRCPARGQRRHASVQC